MIHSKLALLSSLTHASLAASPSFAGAFGLIVDFLLVFFLIILLLCILLLVSTWKVYEKAGVPGWSVLIPFYNQVKLLQITGKPLWWVILLFIPIVNIIVLVIVSRRLAAVFGKGVGFTWGLVLLPFIFYPILAFGKSVYSNTFPPAKPMSEAVKWTLIAFFLFLVLEGFWLCVAASANQNTAPLTVISSDLGYASDGTYVYYYDQPIRNADPSSFKVEGADGYAEDDTAVYYEDQTLTDVDPTTFTALGDGYAVSDKNVYYNGDIIPGAEPASFKLLADSGYAEDSTSVYYNGTQVMGADPATFVLVQDPSGNYNYDAKDKNGYYSSGNPVTKDSQSKN